MSAPSIIDSRFKTPSFLLMVMAVVMLLLGLLMILSASSVESFRLYGSSFLFFNRQVLGSLLGIGLMIGLARIDYRKLRPFARPLLGASIVLLVAVLIPTVGVTRGGSSRWLVIGPLTLQPSEMAKLALILFAAHALEKKGRKIYDLKELMLPVFVGLALVALLILAQPDLGTTLICIGLVATVVFLSGARPRHIAGIGVIGGLVTGALVMIEGYRRVRLFSFLNPWADPLNAGYQTIQGQIALGSGGLLGVGLGQSRQKWSYVPNAHTDFIYAIIGEELGLVGTMVILLMFVFVVYLGIRIAANARDRFGFMLAGGITGWIAIQALVNMGAVTGLLPITGVPLPLISFGGSSLVFTMSGIGILLSVARRGRRAQLVAKSAR